MSPVLGALAALRPADILAALALVRDGLVVDLSLPLDPGLLPEGSPDFVEPLARRDVTTPARFTELAGSAPDGFHLDAYGGSIHLGTHLDGLVHLVHDGRVFGGRAEADVRGPDGWTHGGAETIPPILVRGVLVDVLATRGGEPLEGSAEVTPAMVDEACGATGARIEPGSAVLVRTGKMRSLAATRATFLDAQPGVGVDAAGSLADAGMVLLGTDTGGTEPQPVTDWTRTVHAELLTRRGIHLLEWLVLDELADALAARDRTDFLLVVLPLRLRGATGSWVRPVAVL